MQCDHGSTIGQLNPAEIHYIRSRGISEDEARLLLTYGFVEEIIGYIEDKILTKNLESYVQSLIMTLSSNEKR